MATLVGLLRGINVGGRVLVPMARLREILQGLGYADVRTHLQSGNVVFSTRASAERAGLEIEAALHRELGLDVRVVVRTPAELAGVVSRNLLGDIVTDPARYIVVFLSEPPEPSRLAKIDAAAFAPDVFRLSGREIFAWYPGGMGRSKLAAMLTDKRLGVVATARNWNTVTALLQLAG